MQVIHPRMQVPLKHVSSDAIGLLYQAAAITTSQEQPGANPMLDEWVLLARALLDVITTL
jgi:hypothetical protein